MKTVELYLNICHFCYYKAHYKSHLISKKFNPFRLLFKIPIIKNKAEKEGVNLDESVDIAFGDKRFGLSTIWAAGGLFALLYFFIFGIGGILIKFLTGKTLIMSHFIIFGAIAVSINYIFVFKNDKYIPYFNKFEKWTKKKKRKYCWLTFVMSIIVFAFWLLSFEIATLIR